ncbi:MAG: cysteine peptidase family C39 domain-containing protein, partial [Candidatus Omnitrophota bacterium]
MFTKKPRTEEDHLEQPETKPEFHSSFKAWIRAVAFIVVAVFLPEQMAQAMEYDWRVLWQKPAVGTAFAPAGLRDLSTIDTALAIKNILKDIANKPITSIKISSNLTVDLDKPLEMSNQRIEEIFNWLKGRPCGSKALYDFLAYQGNKVEEQDIAIMVLTVDILSDVVKPEGNPKVIKNSLFALAKTSEFFGQKLYPVKISSLPSAPVPFIAHLDTDHYVLVTRVEGDKVYYSDQHREEFLPKEKFLERFSGYALMLAVPENAILLSAVEAKKILGAKSSSSTWTPAASRTDIQNYANALKKDIRSDIAKMRRNAERAFLKDIAMSVGISLGTSALMNSTFGKNWFGTKNVYAGMSPATRWAINGLVGGTVFHGLSTGKWFSGNWYAYAGIGAGLGAAYPTLANSSFFSSLFGKTTTAGKPTLLDNFKIPSFTSNFGSVGQGLINSGIVSLTSNIFTLAGVRGKNALYYSAATSGAILGAFGGLNHTNYPYGNGLTGGLKWYQGAISGGMTSLTTTYVTNLATDKLGVKSPALASFVGNIAGMAANTMINGYFYSRNNYSLDPQTGKVGNPGDFSKPDDLIKANSWNYTKYTFLNYKNQLIASAAGNLVAELITRSPGIIGLKASDLETMPYASAIGSGITSGIGSLYDGRSFLQSFSRGLLTGGLTIAEAKIESTILKNHPNMTPIMAAYLADAGSAFIEGIAANLFSPDNRMIVNEEHIPSGQTITPVSGVGGVLANVNDRLAGDSMNALSAGYIGRETSLYGDIAYMHTLTASFSPMTPEMLRQQMAKNARSGTVIGDGSIVNLNLRGGTVATLTVQNTPGYAIIPFRGTNPRSGIRYSDSDGNTWMSNGNGTYSLYTESEENQRSSYIAGFGQIVHDIYQAGAVRNMTGTIAVSQTARDIFGLPKSYMFAYQNKTAEGKIETGFMRYTGFERKLADGRIEADFTFSKYGIDIVRFKNVVQNFSKQGQAGAFTWVNEAHWLTGDSKDTYYNPRWTSDGRLLSAWETYSNGKLSNSGLAGITSTDKVSNLTFRREGIINSGSWLKAGDEYIWSPVQPAKGAPPIIVNAGAIQDTNDINNPINRAEIRYVAARDKDGKLNLSGWAYHSLDKTGFYNNKGINGVDYTNTNIGMNVADILKGQKNTANTKTGVQDNSGGIYNATMVNKDKSILFNLEEPGSVVAISNDGIVMSVGDTIYLTPGNYLKGIGSFDDARKLTVTSPISKPDKMGKVTIAPNGVLWFHPDKGSATISGFPGSESQALPVGSKQFWFASSSDAKLTAVDGFWDYNTVAENNWVHGIAYISGEKTVNIASQNGVTLVDSTLTADNQRVDVLLNNKGISTTASVNSNGAWVPGTNLYRVDKFHKDLNTYASAEDSLFGLSRTDMQALKNGSLTESDFYTNIGIPGLDLLGSIKEGDYYYHEIGATKIDWLGPFVFSFNYNGPTFSRSPYLNVGDTSETSGVSGQGVDLNYIVRLKYKDTVSTDIPNFHTGTAKGIFYIDFDGKITEVDFNTPIYSQGAHWGITPLFPLVTDQATGYKYHDSEYGIPITLDMSVGRHAGQSGSLTFGKKADSNPLGVYGDAAYIRKFNNAEVNSSFIDSKERIEYKVPGTFTGEVFYFTPLSEANPDMRSGDISQLIKQGISPIGLSNELRPDLALQPNAHLTSVRLDRTAGKIYLQGNQGEIYTQPGVKLADPTDEDKNKPTPPAEPVTEWTAAAYDTIDGAKVFSLSGLPGTIEEKGPFELPDLGKGGYLDLPGIDFSTIFTGMDEKGPIQGLYEFEVQGINEGGLGFRSTWQDQGARNFVPRSVDDPLADTVDNLPVLTVWGREWRATEGKTNKFGLVYFEIPKGGQNPVPYGGAANYATQIHLPEGWEAKYALEQTLSKKDLANNLSSLFAKQLKDNLEKLDYGKFKIGGTAEFGLADSEIALLEQAKALEGPAKQEKIQEAANAVYERINPNLPNEIKASFQLKGALKDGWYDWQSLSDATPNYGEYVAIDGDDFNKVGFKSSIAIGNTEYVSVGDVEVNEGKFQTKDNLIWLSIPLTTGGDANPQIRKGTEVNISPIDSPFVNIFQSSDGIPIKADNYHPFLGGTAQPDVFSFQKYNFEGKVPLYVGGALRYHEGILLYKQDEATGKWDIDYKALDNSNMPIYKAVALVFNEPLVATQAQIQEGESPIFTPAMQKAGIRWPNKITLKEDENLALVFGPDGKPIVTNQTFIPENKNFKDNFALSDTAIYIKDGVQNTAVVEPGKWDEGLKTFRIGVNTGDQDIDSFRHNQPPNPNPKPLTDAEKASLEALKGNLLNTPGAMEARRAGYHTDMLLTDKASAEVTTEDGKLIGWVDEGSGRLGLGIGFGGGLFSLAGLPGSAFDVSNRIDNPFVVYQDEAIRLKTKYFGDVDVTPQLAVVGDGTERQAYLH